MKVKRIVKFNIKKSHIDYKYIKTQLIESKEIYNFANYILRQLYFKNSNNHKYSLNFIEEYPTLKELFLEYIDENKQFSTLFYKIICEFSKLKQYSINNQVISKKKLKLGYIGTDKMEQGIKIANRHKELDCKCFRIYNKNDKILCELIYEKEIEKVKKNDRVASIDIGLENLFTIAFNYNKKGISIKGSRLKAINQYFNKIKSKLQSLLPNKQYVSKVINQLLYKRTEQLRNYIGYYTDNGIEYKEQEESYTSKASYLDNDDIPTYKEETEEIKFSGKRIKRGIYKSKQEKIINADLNGALNILKKSGEKLIEELEYLKYNNIFTSKLV